MHEKKHFKWLTNLQIQILLILLFVQFFVPLNSFSQVKIIKKIELTNKKTNINDFLEANKKVKKYISENLSKITLFKENGELDFSQIAEIDVDRMFLSKAGVNRNGFYKENYVPNNSDLADINFTISHISDTSLNEIIVNSLDYPNYTFIENTELMSDSICTIYDYGCIQNINYSPENVQKPIIFDNVKNDDTIEFCLNNHFQFNYNCFWLPNQFQEEYAPIFNIDPDKMVSLIFCVPNLENEEVFEEEICNNGSASIYEEIVFVFEKGETDKYLDLTSAKDEIHVGDTTRIKITAKDEFNNELTIPSNTQVQMTTEYGTFLQSNPVVYSTAHNDSITYFTPDSLPNGVDTLEVYLQAVLLDGSGIRGETKIQVLNNKEIELKILQPDTSKRDTLWIINTPEMPRDTCKAVLENYKGEVTFNWIYRVSYSIQIGGTGNNAGRDSIDFTFSSTVINSNTSKFIVDFQQNNNTVLIGGDVKVMLDAITSDSVYHQTVLKRLRIRGRNPLPQTVRTYVQNQQADIELQMGVNIWHESRYSQFYVPGRLVVNNRNIRNYPIFGSPDGHGICQIEYSWVDTHGIRHHNFNTERMREMFWSWQDNVDQGIVIYNQKAASAGRWARQVRNSSTKYAIDHHPRVIYKDSLGNSRNSGYPNAADLTSEELQIDTYQLYQGGHYYVWRPIRRRNPDGPGRWQPRLEPTNKYMTGDNRYQTQQQVEAGNAPQHWND